MKRKILITAFMLLLCTVMIIGAKNLQKSVSSNQEVQKNTSPNITTKTLEEVKETEGQSSEVEKKDETIASKEEVSENSTSKQEETPKNSEPSPTSTSPKTTVQKPVEKKPVVESYNLIVNDTISGKEIKLKVDFDSKKLLYDAMKSTLDTAKKNGQISGYQIDSFGYVKMINGVWEKKPEPSSGWIYYVNGKKASFGIKDDQAVFDSGTIVQFKFYRDAFNEK